MSHHASYAVPSQARFPEIVQADVEEMAGSLPTRGRPLLAGKAVRARTGPLWGLGARSSFLKPAFSRVWERGPPLSSLPAEKPRVRIAAAAGGRAAPVGGDSAGAQWGAPGG